MPSAPAVVVSFAIAAPVAVQSCQPVGPMPAARWVVVSWGPSRSRSDRCRKRSDAVLVRSEVQFPQDQRWLAPIRRKGRCYPLLVPNQGSIVLLYSFSVCETCSVLVGDVGSDLSLSSTSTSSCWFDEVCARDLVGRVAFWQQLGLGVLLSCQRYAYRDVFEVLVLRQEVGGRSQWNRWLRHASRWNSKSSWSGFGGCPTWCCSASHCVGTWWRASGGQPMLPNWGFSEEAARTWRG
eukprot:s359_g38.t1